MPNQSDAQLLREYAAHGSEPAFAALVARHTDLVYSAALRQTGSPELAHEITQSVFTDLARKARALAGTLSADASLAGWLFRGTRFAGLKLLRDDHRRQTRERQFMEHFNPATEAGPESAPGWEQVAPELDEAMAELDDADHEAVLLRYFKNQDFHAVALALGVSDAAAQKRVSRAVERLRELLAKRGVTASAGGLVILISTNAILVAPAGLSAAITAAAVAGTALLTTATATVGKAIAMTTLQKVCVAAAIAIAVGVGIYESLQVTKARREIETIKEQQIFTAAQLEQTTSERDEAARQAAALRGDNERLNRNTAELLRLRGEVGMLRQQKRELEQALAVADARRAGQNPNVAAQPGKFLPFQLHLVMDEPAENTDVMTNSNGGAIHHVQRGPMLDNTSLSSAMLSTNSFGAPLIELDFSPSGAEQFAQITKTNINKKLAIVLGGKLYSVPFIRSEIPSGKVQIAGSFTEEEASELTSKINEAIARGRSAPR